MEVFTRFHVQAITNSVNPPINVVNVKIRQFCVLNNLEIL